MTSRLSISARIVSYMHKVPRLILNVGLCKHWAVPVKGVLNTGHFATRLCYWR
jgi:hypothetical protein